MSVPDLFISQLVYRLALVLLTSLVLLTLASQFGQYVYLELTTHFRLQYVLASLLCAIIFVPCQSWKFVLIAALCAVLNLVSVVPYYRAREQPKLTATSVRVRLFQANVLKINQKFSSLVEIVKETKADVVVLQEVTYDWNEQTRELEQEYPHVVSEPRPGGSGMAIYSRYPFEETRTLVLDDSAHIAILARLNVSERGVALLAMHPTTPLTPKKFADRNRQFSEALAVLRQIGGPKILIGDLNTTMWSPYFTNLVESSGLRDTRLGFGLRTSWPMPLPSFLRIPIDHCLVSEDVRVEDIRIGKSTGSDHRPLIVDLSV